MYGRMSRTPLMPLKRCSITVIVPLLTMKNNLRRTDLAWCDLAAIYQRRGVNLLKDGDRERAAQAFEEAVRNADRGRAKLPLSNTLLRWIRSGLHITAARIADEQRRHNYFSVRRDALNLKRALKLPPNHAAEISSR